ncbi:MAG: methyltransferase [Myxococcota bacterium]
MSGYRVDVEPLPYPSRQRVWRLPKGDIRLWCPPDPEALLDRLIQAPSDPDDKMPYWADIWPSALALAGCVECGLIQVDRRCVLELGAGLGLVSIAAARNGARVRASDWDHDAIEYIRANSQLNGVDVGAERLDWRDENANLEAEVILAADVLYEDRNAPWMMALLQRWARPGRTAWLSDPGRKPAARLIREIRGFRIRRHWRTAPGPAGDVDIQVYQLDAQ